MYLTLCDWVGDRREDYKSFTNQGRYGRKGFTVKKELGYTRFIFTQAQQTTLCELLETEMGRLREGTALERTMSRRYKGLMTSFRRQARRQTMELKMCSVKLNKKGEALHVST